MKPTNSDNQMYERIEQLENRITQLESTISTLASNSLTIETLVARLSGSTDQNAKKPRKSRSKREWTPEEKAAFHARMVAGRLAKEKSLASKK